MIEDEIIVGLVVERIAPLTEWGEPIWMPLQALDGVPDATPWTVLATGPDRVRYYAGAYPVHLYASETTFYRDNLTAERPCLWVVMSPHGAEPPVEILAVTADPTEGEGYTQTGTNTVEVVDMPPGLASEIAAFVADHHVEQVFEKRKRDKRPPDLMGRRRPLDGGS